MKKYNWLRFVTFLVSAMFSMLAMLAWPAELDHFRQYHYPADGFEAAFPQKPLESRTERGTDQGYVNSYKAVVINPISQYSVFVSHSPKRMFEDASIDAFLEGIVRGLTQLSDDSVVKYTKRTKFLGFPAIEYQFTFSMQGIRAIGRGLVFIVDGEHIRLSQIYAENESNADNMFQKFVSAFQLTPIDVALNGRFNNFARGISFSLPEGWQQVTPKNAQITALISNPGGHTITVIDSGTPSYVCENFRTEVQTTQEIQATGRILAKGRPVTWVKFTAYNPAAGIRMTSAHYCINTSKGAVVMSGMSPEETFFRSETIFRKVAASMLVRK